MLEMNANVREEYLRAMHLGQKEVKEAEAAGREPGPAVLDAVLPGIDRSAVVELPVQEIPADRIVGTKTAGRISAFSASFYPLSDVSSEFAGKWMTLCKAHLSDTGIREPIVCYEYLSDFYVQEGNKRVSVLRYFGASSIPARIFRVLPADRSDIRVAAYYEFVEFHRATGIYDIQFRKPGGYARLSAALGKAPGEPWTDREKQRLLSCYHYFRKAFQTVRGKQRDDISPEDALLLFLKVYPYDALHEMTPAALKKALASLWGDVQAASSPEDITVKTLPEEGEAKT